MYRVLLDLDLPNKEQSDNLLAVQDLWLNGKMTNFDYLMQLNKLAGRSFNDLMQYPIFPFVLSQYNQKRLDLSDGSCYRFDSCRVSHCAWLCILVPLSRVFLCLCVYDLESSFLVCTMQVHLQKVAVKFVYQGHWVKVKVTRANKK